MKLPAGITVAAPLLALALGVTVGAPNVARGQCGASSGGRGVSVGCYYAGPSPECGGDACQVEHCGVCADGYYDFCIGPAYACMEPFTACWGCSS